MGKIIFQFGSDGSIIARRPFGRATIALQRLQFSSNYGTAFCISSERVPQVIVYESSPDISSRQRENGRREEAQTSLW